MEQSSYGLVFHPSHNLYVAFAELSRIMLNQSLDTCIYTYYNVMKRMNPVGKMQKLNTLTKVS